MNDLLKDPIFFYSIAFVIFLGLAYRYGKTPILNWIDSEILKIRDELDQARKLRAEAETLMASFKTKQMAGFAEAESIVSHAKAEALVLKAQAELNLQNTLARHEQMALERIRLAEAEALAEIRTAAVDHAMEIAHKVLAEKLDEATLSKLTDQALAEITKLAPTKIKAA